ncbi:hypothetical protein COO91_09001 [Nostoc flagelliforme CCNUN1]|uniref:Uncharacterized protein n=1 Tax=Nostoc flagelliforme CCNUN1 TaxID=2038116 RepID=A0A2K8T579_9NOSO|nr:hypothetical protein [Nostoc flagelliforme]AUB42852.1 hypothetical protein COO91_09001 [Nostoc flagelliforme CCNUN1]
MGQRANLILVESGKYQLFYNHWCANTIYRDLFWGVEHAVEFIRAQEEVDESGWLDEVWAEGGAVVDLDKRVFLIFAGEDIASDVQLRRVYLDVLRSVWQGWQVQWAYEGIADMAEYVGFPRENVLVEVESEDVLRFEVLLLQHLGWIDTVASIVTEDKAVKLFPLYDYTEDYLYYGSPLLAAIREYQGLDDLIIADGDPFPRGGFHLDIMARTLEFWVAPSIPDIKNRVRRKWQGWSVQSHRDRFEFQAERTSGRLRFPTGFERDLKTEIETMLLGEMAISEAELILQMVQARLEEGQKVKVNPWIMADVCLDVDLMQRQEILNRAFEALSQKQKN